MKAHTFSLSIAAFTWSALCCSQVVSADTITLFPQRDTTFFEADPAANMGNSDVVVGTTAGGKKSRGLWEFDIAASIPAGSIIHSVLFEVGIIRQSNQNQPSAYALHRFLKDWTEGNGGIGANSNGAPALTGESTWDREFHGSTLWSAPGGQAGTEYSAIASATGPVASSAGVTYGIASTAALVADAQGWLDFPSLNNGWFFLATDEATGGTARRFSSSEAPGAGLSPRITVQFTPVPEPRTIVTALGGAGILLGYRRRRH